MLIFLYLWLVFGQINFSLARFISFLIIRFFSTSQRKKRIDVKLDELWTVDLGLPADRGLSTIIRSTSTRLQALVRLRIILLKIKSQLLKSEW